MYPVTVSISPPLLAEAAVLGLAGLVDIFWAHIQPGDGLEHISTRENGDAVEIVLFVKSDTRDSAYQVATDICRRIISCSRPLAVSKLAAFDADGGFIRIS